MDEQNSEIAPLAYYDNSRDPWLPMVRFMAIAAIVQAGLVILMYLSHLATIVCSMIFPSSRMSFDLWRTMLFESPAFLAAAIMLIGGIVSMRLMAIGRRTLLIGIVIYIPASFLTGLVNIIVYALNGYFTRFGGPWTSFQLSAELFSALQHCLLPAFVWVFFRRASVRELFATVNR